MNEIVILSGKGGTGKTSVAAALAIIAKNDVVVADCDVDAANMHLLLEPDFASKKEFFSGVFAFVNQDICSLCGDCVRVCRFDAITLTEETCVVDAISCEGCGYCEKVCPVHAIEMKKCKTGHVFVSKIKTGATMVHARLDAGGENSGKLVARVKNEAKSLAKIQNKSFVIVDGSPGLGCPVISSLSGAQLVLLITEPSKSALADMKRLYQLIDNFKIKTACIINKSDLNLPTVKEIHAFLSENDIPLITEIPYDPVFTKSMVQGKSVVEIDEGYEHLMTEIWKKIKKI